LKITLFN